MRMEPPVTPQWRKIITPYRVIADPNRFGFVIEAVGQVPDNPRLWVQGTAAVIHHSPQCFVVLPDLSESVIAEIAECNYLFIEERYQRRHTETIAPWGLERGGGERHTYTVPVIHTEKIGDIRKIFNELPDLEPDPEPTPDPPWRMSTD